MQLRNKFEKIVMGIAFAVFVIYAITLIFPFLWLIMNSLKGQREFTANIWGLPQLQANNYSKAFSLEIKGFSLVDMFGNSILITIIGTAISIFVSSMSAYVVSKYDFKLKRLIYMISITIILVPTVGSIAATYQLFQITNLYNTYLGLFLLYSGGFGFSFILLYGYFRNISWSYAEAAFIDGCSDFKVFLKVMMPQVAPALIALAVIQSIGLWNDYFTPYMFLPQYPTLAVGLNGLVEGIQSRGDWPTLFAVMVVSIIPILIMFILFQKTIMENTVAGGLKG